MVRASRSRLRALGLRRLLRGADYMSAPLSGRRLPNGTRSAWNQGEGGFGSPTPNGGVRGVFGVRQRVPPC